MSNAKPPSPEETLSANLLKVYLEERGVQAAYSQVFPDPPDFLFTIVTPSAVEERWAVEVTGIVQYLDWQGREYRRKDFESRLHELCATLNEDFEHEFTQSYGLFVVGPLNPKVYRTLGDRIMEYVRSGSTEETALDSREALQSVWGLIGPNVDKADPHIEAMVGRMAAERQLVTIRAYPSREKKGLTLASMIGGATRLPERASDSGGIASPRFTADIGESARYAVNRALKEKVPKLAPLSGYDRKILLVWNDLPMLTSDEAKQTFGEQNLISNDLSGVFFAEYGWKSLSLIVDCSDLNRLLDRDTR